MVGLGLPSNAPQFAKGGEVLLCRFDRPARRRTAPAGYTTENTFVALGGHLLTNRIATGVRVSGCAFSGDFHSTEQQAPLHGVTISACVGAEIEKNSWYNFAGTCIYSDTGAQYGTRVHDNKAEGVYRFVQHTVREYFGADAWKTGAVVDFRAERNKISLVAPGIARSAWDAAGGDPTVLGLLLDPMIAGQYRDVLFFNTELTAAKEFWTDRYGGFREGVWLPGGDVPAVFLNSLFTRFI